jgi:hypothetical protein
LNLAIEYYGSYWHASPNIYKKDDIIKYPNKIETTAEDIWKKDKERNKIIVDLGYNIFIVWQDSNEDEIIEEIYDLLKGRLNE